MPVGKTRTFRAIPRDRGGRQVENSLTYEWSIVEGSADLDPRDGEMIVLTAPTEPQLLRIRVLVRQHDIEAAAEALVTVTDSLLPERPQSQPQAGMPEYTFEKRPGELWRSRFDVEQNLIVVNVGHRDLVFAARQKTLKLRYICRLFAKELVLHNFPGYNPSQLLERMIELSLYTEEHLR